MRHGIPFRVTKRTTPIRCAIVAHLADRIVGWRTIAGVVSVADVVEAMHPAELNHGQNVKCVHGRVSPTLVVEAAGLVQVVEEAQVGLVAKYGKRSNLEVSPELKAIEATRASLLARQPLVRREEVVHLFDSPIGSRAHSARLVQPSLDRIPQVG